MKTKLFRAFAFILALAGVATAYTVWSPRQPNGSYLAIGLGNSGQYLAMGVNQITGAGSRKLALTSANSPDAIDIWSNNASESYIQLLSSGGSFMSSVGGNGTDQGFYNSGGSFIVKWTSGTLATGTVPHTLVSGKDSTAATANTLAWRNPSGQVHVAATPTAGAHATSKTYVDAQIAAAGGGNSISEVFTATGTFNVPADVSLVWVTACAAGGGGGGGSGNGGGGAGGGGGGSGECVYRMPYDVTPSGTVGIIMGSGSTGGTSGGTSGNGGSGANGGQLTFGGIVLQGGGGGNGAVNTPAAGAGGTGGTTGDQATGGNPSNCGTGGGTSGGVGVRGCVATPSITGGGGGGGNTASSNGGRGGVGYGGFSHGSGGTGSASGGGGGGGAGSLGGKGGNGGNGIANGAAGTRGSGGGGGGGGNGGNAAGAGGAGGAGFIIVEYID